MNILIPDSWLRDFIETKATAKEIAYYLSLSSQSVEKIKKQNQDFIYDIEITTNRPDCLSVYGIARELAAILPRYGIPTRLLKIQEKLKLPKVKKNLPLKVKIEDKSLCPRFTALVFDNIAIKPSPKIAQERLQKSGIRAINNVIDISNYLMLAYGQPMHTFDYDKIKGATMILRNSKKGEEITTLDGAKRKLPKGAIVIEDGEKRLIDLCGIMGGKNSEVDEKTKRVLLFIQTYNPIKIRKTCQSLAFRTEAASRFEKGVDEEGVIVAMKEAIKLFKKWAGGRVASKLIDIYPNPSKTKKVSLSQEKLEKVLGIDFSLKEAKKILIPLGFSPSITSKPPMITCSVPHWRRNDIEIGEDLIEEIARIYGYHHLPTKIPPLSKAPKNHPFNSFFWEEKAKETLADWGFTETISYSMISKKLLDKTGFDTKNLIEIQNPLSQDLVYMRPSLIPSLLVVVNKNFGQEEKIKIFEMAHVYLPKKKTQLPEEKMMLTGVLTGDCFYEAKGIVEELLNKLGVQETKIKPYEGNSQLFHRTKTAEITDKGESLGQVGEINPTILSTLETKEKITFFNLNFDRITSLATTQKTYQTIPSFPPVIEDIAFIIPPKTPVGELSEEIKKTSALVKEVNLFDSYQNTRTFRITYQSSKKTLTDRQVKKIRDKIIKKIKSKFGAKIKQ